MWPNLALAPLSNAIEREDPRKSLNLKSRDTELANPAIAVSQKKPTKPMYGAAHAATITTAHSIK